MDLKFSLKSAEELYGKLYVRVMIALAVFVGVFFILGDRFAFTITDSVGYHLLWKIPFNGEYERFDLVQIPAKKEDSKYLPVDAKYFIKKIGCLPGEKILRVEEMYYCVDQSNFRHEIGPVKFKSMKGTPIYPFMYDPNIYSNEYILKEDEFLAIGKYSKDSYDGRYRGPSKFSEITQCFVPLF